MTMKLAFLGCGYVANMYRLTLFPVDVLLGLIRFWISGTSLPSIGRDSKIGSNVVINESVPEQNSVSVAGLVFRTHSTSFV